MKIFSVFSTMTLASLLLASCGSIKKSRRHVVSNNEKKSAMSEKIYHSANDLPLAPAEYTHEIAEADADDQIIKNKIGSNEIDAEIKDNNKSETSYSRDFLKQKNTKRMQFWVEYFTKQNPERFQRFINNGEEYRSIVENIFEANGLPKDLYYVGLIESGYYLGAKSHASAVGPWQFIKSTGKRYGLKTNSEFDERRDLQKSTQAAAMYFKDLFNVFSSWELALSAYNAGEYGMIRRIMKHGTRDFYELSKNKYLPSETINYVPKVLAAMHIVKNAEKYGFKLPRKNHKLFDNTELKAIKKNVSLTSIATKLNVSVKLLKKLNPELKVSKTPRSYPGTYFLRIPHSKYSYQLPEDNSSDIKRFIRPESRKELNRRTAKNKISNEEELKNRPLSYKVRRGDTLISISRKYNLSLKKLAQFNNMSRSNLNIKAGQRIKLYQENTQAKSNLNRSVKITNRPIVYKVNKGDNLTSIARLFDIKLSKIKRANKLKKGKIIVGQKIVLPDTKKGIYTVKRGDHLSKVAKELKQPLDALIKLNSLKPSSIYPGQKIIVNMD